MTGLSSRTAAGFVGVIVVSDPWHRVGTGLADPWQRVETAQERGVQEISFGCSTMLREALRCNGFRGSGDSVGIRLTGLLTLC